MTDKTCTTTNTLESQGRIEIRKLKCQNQQMKKLNAPPMYLRTLGVGAGLLMLVTMFFGMAVVEGSGSFLAGLLIYAFGYMVIACVMGLLTMGLGRLAGAKVTCILVIVAMLGLSAWTWIMAQPRPTFKRMVWSEMPASLMILGYNRQSSFNDGSTYVFELKADPGTVREMVNKLGLEAEKRESMELIGVELLAYTLSESAAFFRRSGLELIVSAERILLIRKPSLDDLPQPES